MTKKFWSEKRAKAFAENIKAQGFESVVIWSERDFVNQCTVYTVKWY